MRFTGRDEEHINLVERILPCKTDYSTRLIQEDPIFTDVVEIDLVKS